MNGYVGNNCLNKPLTMTLKSIDIEIRHFLYSWPHRKTMLCITMSQLIFTCSKSTIETLKKRCEIRSKLTTKTPERRHYLQWRHYRQWHISHLFLVFLLLTLFVSWGVRILYVIWNYCSCFSEIKILCGKNLYGVFSNAEMCPFHIKN